MRLLEGHSGISVPLGALHMVFLKAFVYLEELNFRHLGSCRFPLWEQVVKGLRGRTGFPLPQR